MLVNLCETETKKPHDLQVNQAATWVFEPGAVDAGTMAVSNSCLWACVSEFIRHT